MRADFLQDTQCHLGDSVLNKATPPCLIGTSACPPPSSRRCSSCTVESQGSISCVVTGLPSIMPNFLYDSTDSVQSFWLMSNVISFQLRASFIPGSTALLPDWSWRSLAYCLPQLVQHGHLSTGKTSILNADSTDGEVGVVANRVDATSGEEFFHPMPRSVLLKLSPQLRADYVFQ